MGQDPADLKDIDAVEREVDTLRARTEELIEELERRIQDTVENAKERVVQVKRAVDLPAHAREHPRAAAGIGAGTVALVGLGIWLGFRRRREQRRPLVRLRRRALALRQLLDNPERMRHAEPPLGRKLLGVALAAAVGALVRGLAELTVRRATAPLLPAKA